MDAFANLKLLHKRRLSTLKKKKIKKHNKLEIFQTRGQSGKSTSSIIVSQLFVSRVDNCSFIIRLHTTHLDDRN